MRISSLKKPCFAHTIQRALMWRKMLLWRFPYEPKGLSRGFDFPSNTAELASWIFLNERNFNRLEVLKKGKIGLKAQQHLSEILESSWELLKHGRVYRL